MRFLGPLLLGVGVGGLVAYLSLRNPDASMMMLRTGGDTVIINAQRDTVIINARRDTIIINKIDSDYCDQVPRPKGCPPVTQ